MPEGGISVEHCGDFTWCAGGEALGSLQQTQDLGGKFGERFRGRGPSRCFARSRVLANGLDVGTCELPGRQQRQHVRIAIEHRGDFAGFSGFLAVKAVQQPHYRPFRFRQLVHLFVNVADDLLLQGFPFGRLRPVVRQEFVLIPLLIVDKRVQAGGSLSAVRLKFLDVFLDPPQVLPVHGGGLFPVVAQPGHNVLHVGFRREQPQGNLTHGRFPPQSILQFLGGDAEVADLGALVYGQANGAVLVGNGLLDSLPDPVDRIGGQDRRAVQVELGNGLEEAEIAFLFQIAEGHGVQRGSVLLAHPEHKAPIARQKG